MCSNLRIFWKSFTPAKLQLSGCTRRLFSKANRNILTLHDRGLLENVFPKERSRDLYNSLVESPQCFYCGFDPTADSLHVGNLLAVMALLHCQRAGHQVIALLGTATALIGDPSGKTKERPTMQRDIVTHNANSISKSLLRIFKNHEKHFWQNENTLQQVKVLENGEWYRELNIIDFLSTAGRYFRMGTLLRRERFSATITSLLHKLTDTLFIFLSCVGTWYSPLICVICCTSVQSRLQSAEGMCLTEFTYQMFQAYDWLYLYKKYQCNVQIGGNDQMGNIMTGYDLIQYVHNKPVFGLTVPIITSTTGDKLGKTAGNAVWLNPDRTTPFEFYQYFLRMPDNDMEKYLKLFTFLPNEKVSEIMKDHRNEPKNRRAQKILAENVTKLVHGEDGLASALRCSKALYGGSIEDLVKLNKDELDELFGGASSCEMFLEPGTTIIDMLMQAKCFSRIVDAERVMKAGGVSVNMQKVNNPEAVLLPGQHILQNNTSVVRVGKRHYYLIKWLGL